MEVNCSYGGGSLKSVIEAAFQRVCQRYFTSLNMNGESSKSKISCYYERHLCGLLFEGKSLTEQTSANHVRLKIG